MSVNPYLAIEGAIGVGKTTLARLLGEALPGEVLLEVFEENPFLSDFYADRARYAFQTQIFFLLSRYRQQHKVITETLRRGPLVSDYLFAKDWLFAHLNLSGDELSMYERVHAILGEQIPTPSLVVYLRASTDTLMHRITSRDRPYERQMSRDYINALRLAYESFFSNYTAAPILSVHTDDLDFVRNNVDRVEIIKRVQDALQRRAIQLPLPEVGEALPTDLSGLAGSRRLPDFQRLHHALDREQGLVVDLFYDYIHLTGKIGELGRALTNTWIKQEQLLAQVGNRQEAHDRALEAVRANLQDGLADALSCLLKIANDAGVDLESAYIRKMGQDRQRAWGDSAARKDQ